MNYEQTVPQKQMKARVKSTGEIIEARAFMDHDGNTTWLEDATNTEYYPDELVFLPAVIGKMQPINSNEPLLNWLCERFCLVEKSAVRNKLESAFTDKRESKTGAFGHCRWHELSFLFPEIAKEVENHESY